MELDKLVYRVEADVWLDRADIAHLEALSGTHYDAHCRTVGHAIASTAELKLKFEDPGVDRVKQTLTWNQMDALCKLTEAEERYPHIKSPHKLGGAFRAIFDRMSEAYHRLNPRRSAVVTIVSEPGVCPTCRGAKHLQNDATREVRVCPDCNPGGEIDQSLRPGQRWA